MNQTPEQLSAAVRRLTIPAIIGATGIHLATIFYAWGDWTTMAMLTAAAVVLHGVNTWFSLRGYSQLGADRAELYRAGFNAVGYLFCGALIAWGPPFWMWFPFMAVMMNSRRRRLFHFTLATLALVAAAATATGASLWLAGCTLGSSIVCYWMAAIRVQMIEELVEERDHARTALQTAHRRALVQEKLSSLGMLAAGVAHEVNNPMAYVKSNVRSLLLDLERLPDDRALLEEYRTEVLPATLDGIERVIAIVADLRRFARGEPDSMVEYNLDEQVQAAARIARSRFSPGVRLKVELDGPPSAMGRPGQIVQVLVNLIVNAAQAVEGKQGVIQVSTFHNDETLWIQVRDNGPGMEPEVHSRLFEPFFTTKPVGEGTGLGLPVVHGIVQAHNGEISVETSAGKGACFTIKLPRYPMPVITPAPGTTAAAA